MASPRGDTPARPPLVRVDHPVSVDMVAMQNYRRLPKLADLPEASIQRSARLSLGQSRIPRLRRRANAQRAQNPDMGVVMQDFTNPRYRPLASSQATVIHPGVTAGPAAPTPADSTALPGSLSNPPTPGGVWATNASNFASGSNPKFRFVNDMRSSEPRLKRDKGKGVDKRHNTEPVANGKECHCFECDALTKGLLSSEMICAYLAMRGVQNGEGLFEELMAKHRENGQGWVVPSCPRAREKMNKEQKASASKREGKRPAVNAPASDRANPGLSQAGPSAAAGLVNAGPSSPFFNDFRPSVAGPDPSVAATVNTTPSLADVADIGFPKSAHSFSTDFDFDDSWDDGDVVKAAITADDFLRMASGVSRAETDKPLPHLPLNPGETSHAQLENENESGSENNTVVGSDSGNESGAAIINDSGNEIDTTLVIATGAENITAVENVSAVQQESGNGTAVRDRVAEQGVRAQVCEDTMEALTGAYTVSSNPSVLNEPPGVHHLDRLRGAFGTLFSRMQPRFGERLDRIRLGLSQEDNSSISVFSDNQYTDNELEAALASPSATPINGIAPDQVQISLAEAEHTVGHIEGLEAAAHRRAVGTSQHLDFLRNMLGRITAGAQYIAQYRASLRRSKIRRSVGHRLRVLEYRRERALDNLRAEEARHARDSEAILVAEESVERVLETVGLATVEEVLEEASTLWLQDHGQEENE